MRTLVAGVAVLPPFLDAVVVLLPVLDVPEVALPPLRTAVDGRVTLVIPLPVGVEAVLPACVPMLRVAVPVVLRAVVPEAVPRDSEDLLTVVPDAFLPDVVPDAEAVFLTEDVRTAPETPAPETDEWELEASPPPVPLEP